MGSQPDPRIVPAEPQDGDSIRRLLTRCDLTTDRIGGGAVFWLIQGQHEAEGCVALEMYDTTGILRSLAVDPERRGRGWRRALIEWVMHEARARGAIRVVAFTLTVKDLFLQSGFTEILREELSGPVRECWQFKTHACDNAACLQRMVS